MKPVFKTIQEFNGVEMTEDERRELVSALSFVLGECKHPAGSSILCCGHGDTLQMFLDILNILKQDRNG